MNIGRAVLATWRAVLADPGAVLLLLIACVGYSFFYPLPYERETLERVPVAVVDLDHTALSRQLIRFAQASPQLDVRSISSDLPAAQAALASGAVFGVAVIPSGFRADLMRGKHVVLQVVGNGAYPLVSKTLLSGFAGAAGTLSAGIDVRRFESRGATARQALESAMPVNYLARPLFNVNEGYGSYVVPGVAPLIVQQTLVIGISLLLGLWAEQQAAGQRTLAGQLRAAPVSGLLGLWLAFALIGSLNALYFFGFVYHVQGYPQAPRLAEMLSVAVLFGLACSAFGLFLGQLFGVRERGMQMLLFSSIPMLFVSGFPWPAESLPEPIATLRWLLPSTAGIQASLAVNQLGAPFSAIRTELLALLAHSLGWLAAAACLFLRRWQPR
ncbi:ABC transporter permease [Niveibacterium sp. 24ML]|uniref:ABC transporter permease n=1 Tax=Niveibacterium sp. 24ML TaxID=2985512 RepID=UPI00226FA992|nr:ABC transporter permease [Niveibacterium sp. 24ML]MCX9155053.1 ABC transporter permease [Niveibacterium sp. 24ML]